MDDKDLVGFEKGVLRDEKRGRRTRDTKKIRRYHVNFWKLNEGDCTSLQAAKATNLSSPDRARGRRAGCQGNRVSLVKMRGWCWSADERWENVQPEDVEGGHCWSHLYLFFKFKRWVCVIKIVTFSSRADIIRVHDKTNDLPMVFPFPPVPLWSP